MPRIKHEWSDIYSIIESEAKAKIKKEKEVLAGVFIGEFTTQAPIDSGNLLGNTVVTVGTEAPSNERARKVSESERGSFADQLFSKVEKSAPFSSVYIQNFTEYNPEAEIHGWPGGTPPYEMFQKSWQLTRVKAEE